MPYYTSDLTPDDRRREIARLLATALPEGQTGDFLVVRIARDQLTVAQRKMGEWGITQKILLPAAAGSAV
jgi:hypothetical protein